MCSAVILHALAWAQKGHHSNRVPEEKMEGVGAGMYKSSYVMLAVMYVQFCIVPEE